MKPPIARFVLMVTVALVVFPWGENGHAAPAPPVASARLLDAASLQLAHQTPSRVARWLRRQPDVAGADVGLDGQTVDVRFRGGLQAAILPNTLTSSRPPFSIRARPDLGRVHPPVHRPVRRFDLGTGERRRALVLMPFATDLDMTQHGRDVESRLEGAGFTVDMIYDRDVTVTAMAGMSRYDLVYIVTHSGVNKYGDVTIATGEPADPNNVDPNMEPLVKEGSLIVTAISGSTQHYYGLRSRFVSDHEDTQFPPNALVYFNSCSLWKGSLLWQALSGRGVATMLGWDGFAVTLDDAPTADAFFGAMVKGDSVAQALDVMDATGYDTSYWAGKMAYLRYLGDGTLTLDGRSSATPTPLPTDTPAPTDTPLPTATPIPTSTPTRVPPPPLSVSLRRAVRPGDRQVISAASVAGAAVRFRIAYPNGDKQQAVRLAGVGGRVRYVYFQPANKTTPARTDVSVVVDASAPSGTTTVRKKYSILLR